MNEVGILYKRAGRRTKKIFGQTWFYKQFDPHVLNAVMFALDERNMSFAERADPVLVSRAFTLMVGEILEGEWNQNYTLPGTKPFAWTGSEAILKEYFFSGGETVRYSQCWVFAGALTTMYRSVGIASRPVTCYAAGQDFDGNLIIDKDRIVNGVMSDDSVWNYHVWNQCWMKRRDLNNSMFDGWQELDGTPLHRSNGEYQMGPTSFKQVKRGVFVNKYDLRHLYSEVNSDYFKYDGNRVTKINRNL
ncbi:protein-glutamine gamma-glutamyltransferase 4-like protein [Dinothrombium tinctorium]|uniref:Protein-glutamine gamma-glutamyltransferase 4-like protein n=1 Tax=Dinothrombium tinctorium TaxID=1965070 RepID=A0A443QUT5_9ACAR|nr:protein-glutamine gamma-glutamyltransferase 4-like protein [Dinothrombium tinctorium]